MAKQRANDLDAVTDGEFRCHMRHLNFLQNLGGITHVEAQLWSVRFKGRQPKAKWL